MTEQEIKQAVKRLANLQARYEEIQAMAIFYPTSQDIARQENSIAKEFNATLAKLAASGVEPEFKPLPVFVEEKPRPMDFLQTLFVESGLDMRDLLREDKPKPSAFGDGLASLVGY